MNIEDEQLIECISQYKKYRESEDWSQKEKYKWDFLREHQGIFNNLDDLLGKFTSLGSQNFFPFVWKQSMFRHLAVYHEIELRGALDKLFNENEDLEKRVSLFIDQIRDILQDDQKWVNKNYLEISLLLDATTFLLFLKNPKEYFLYKKLGALKKFAFHFNLKKELIDSVHKVHRYIIWQNFIKNDLLPVLEKYFNKDADFIDCQDFIYCLAEHNICNWNLAEDKEIYLKEKKTRNVSGISKEEDEKRIKYLISLGILHKSKDNDK